MDPESVHILNKTIKETVCTINITALLDAYENIH